MSEPSRAVAPHNTPDGDAALATSIFDPSLRPIVVSTLTAVSLVAFDGLGVGAAQNGIAADLGHVGLISWVFTAFGLTLAIASVTVGSLIDTLGLRRVYRFTLVVFFVSSLLCAAAPSMHLLIAARAVQGIGGGLIVSVALAAIGISIPANLRSHAFALNSTVWGVFSFAGPALAALLLHSPLGWRAIFLLNLPLTALAAVVGWSRLPGPAQHVEPTRFDLRGTALLSAFTLLVLVGTFELTLRSTAPLLGAGVLMWLTWRTAGRTANPVLARRYLDAAPVAMINWAVFTLFVGGLSVDIFVPLFVRGALGHSNTVGALSIGFLSIGWTTASVTAARVIGRRATETSVMVVGFGITLVPLTIALLAYTSDTPLWVVALCSFLQGAGIGAATNAGLTLLQRATPIEEMGRANASHQFLRNLGSTIGVAIAGGILFGVVRRRLGSLATIRPLLNGDDGVAVTDATRNALAAGFRTSHILALAVTIAGLVITLRLRAYLRHTRTGV